MAGRAILAGRVARRSAAPSRAVPRARPDGRDRTRRTRPTRPTRGPATPAARDPRQGDRSRTSTASCPGSSSTPASCTRRATSATRCSSGSSSWRSSPATSTSSSRSASPACASRSRPARSPARRTAGPPTSSSPPRATRVLELVAEHSAIYVDVRARARRRGHRARRLRRDPRAPRGAPPALPRRDLPGPDAARGRSRATRSRTSRRSACRSRSGCATRRPASAASPGSRCPQILPRLLEVEPSRFVLHRPGHRGQPRRPVHAAWRSSSTTSSGSPATPTSRSRRTRPTTCCWRSRRSSAGAGSARRSASRSSGRCRPATRALLLRGLGLGRGRLLRGQRDARPDRAVARSPSSTGRTSSPCPGRRSRRRA